MLPKLQAIAHAGFSAVEVFMEDLEWLAHESSPRRGQKFSSSFTSMPVNPPSKSEVSMVVQAASAL
jgi:hypothetical protein